MNSSSRFCFSLFLACLFPMVAFGFFEWATAEEPEFWERRATVVGRIVSVEKTPQAETVGLEIMEVVCADIPVPEKLEIRNRLVRGNAAMGFRPSESDIWILCLETNNGVWSIPPCQTSFFGTGFAGKKLERNEWGDCSRWKRHIRSTRAKALSQTDTGAPMDSRSRALLDKWQDSIARARLDNAHVHGENPFLSLDELESWSVQHSSRHGTASVPMVDCMSVAGNDGTALATIVVQVAVSPDAALDALARDIAWSTLPLEVLLESWQVSTERPGDFRAVFQVSGAPDERPSVDSSILHFVHGNLHVGIRTFTPELSATEIAEKLESCLHSIPEQWQGMTTKQ